jgi:hypothetical protein
MTNLRWSLVETAGRLLDGDEREVVLGDVAEAGGSAWRGMLDVMGLVVRRQITLWKSWRPWVAAFGVTLPCSLFLMGLSLTVTESYLRVTNPVVRIGAGQLMTSALLALICRGLLLIGFSWTCAHVAGSLSRRTVWITAMLCCSPCLFCLERFRVPHLSRYCLLLFLAPALLGAWQSWRDSRVNLRSAVIMALGLTLLMFLVWSNSGQRWWSPGPWILNGTLIWPAWYLVATAYRRSPRPPLPQ